MPSIGHDTKYLQELVGDALARGCASTIAAQPNDPVDFLGQWLLRYVKNAEVEGSFYEERKNQLESKKAQLEEEKDAAFTAQRKQGLRKDAIAKLAAMQDEPSALVKRAIDLIKQNTSAGAVYAAAVAEPEEPDWTPPEDPEDPAANESEDEADPVQTPGEGEAAAEGGEEAAAAPAEEEPAAADEEGGSAKVQRPIDYSKKYLSYMLASEGQEFMAKVELRRPGPPPEDAPEDAEPEPVPFTFRILDERMPMVYAENVAFEKSIKFFRDFPKIGAYQACGVQVPDKNGEFKVILAADTLFPEASGQPMSQEDKDFIWEVSLALGKAFEASEKKFKEGQEGKSAKEAIEALQKQITEVFFPPPPEPVEGEEGEAAPAPAAPAPAEGEAPADGEAPAEEDAPPPEGEDVDPLVLLRYEVKKLTKDSAASDAARDEAAKALDLASKVLACINGTLASVSADAVATLRNSTVVLQATFHVLKALFYVLGKEPESFSNWKRAFEHFKAATFEQAVAYDATQERDVAVWQNARRAYKAVADPAKLEAEMPETYLGVVLTMWLKQVRKVGRRAAASRALIKASEELSEQLATKSAALAEAEREKAEADEAARIAAEEEAARLAAEEAAAAGEGAEGGEEATADE